MITTEVFDIPVTAEVKVDESLDDELSDAAILGIKSDKGDGKVIIYQDINNTDKVADKLSGDDVQVVDGSIEDRLSQRSSKYTDGEGNVHEVEDENRDARCDEGKEENTEEENNLFVSTRGNEFTEFTELKNDVKNDVKDDVIKTMRRRIKMESYIFLYFSLFF